MIKNLHQDPRDSQQYMMLLKCFTLIFCFIVKPSQIVLWMITTKATSQTQEKKHTHTHTLVHI
jgi:hypothetical protein